MESKNIKILSSNIIEDTSSNLINCSTVIPKYIKCIETDTNKYKIGDGIHIYSELEINDLLPSSLNSSQPGTFNNYSTEEQFTGRYWINNKKIYEKTVDCGAMPNDTTKSILHNIPNVEKFIEVTCIVSYNNSIQGFTLPWVLNFAKMYATDTQLIITIVTNWTTYSGVAYLRYTCTNR
jgi:hypothetical protein